MSDTSGRPWREGVTDFALGAAGLEVLDDRRGTVDASGRPLTVTVRAIADEVAALGDLVKGKSAGTPVAVVRGLGRHVTAEDGPGAGACVRVGPTDWFRHGHVEAVRAALGGAPVGPPALDPAGEPVAGRLARALAVARYDEGVAHEKDSAATTVEVTAPEDDDPDHWTVRVAGPAFTVGRLAGRLEAAAWSEDLLAEPVDRVDSATPAATTLVVYRVSGRRLR